MVTRANSFRKNEVIQKTTLHFMTNNYESTLQEDLLNKTRKPNMNLKNTSTGWKVSQYGVFSSPYFLVLGLNTVRYSVSLRIQLECGKIRTRKNSVFGHFSPSVVVWEIYKTLNKLNTKFMRDLHRLHAINIVPREKWKFNLEIPKSAQVAFRTRIWGI